jgi:integrase/recombinase XerD
VSGHAKPHLASVPSGPLAPFTDRPRRAVAADRARFRGMSRNRTESDLRSYLTWCAERGLDPLAAQPPHLELYIRWMQEIRRIKPSTVSRRFSVTAGFYRTCVLASVLEHSPAEHVRRPSVPAESPTLGFTHLQFEALLTAARESDNPCDFALVAMLGLPGLPIFEATGTDRTCSVTAAASRSTMHMWSGQFGGWAGEVDRAVDHASAAQGRPAGGALPAP